MCVGGGVGVGVVEVLCSIGSSEGIALCSVMKYCMQVFSCNVVLICILL